MIRCDALVIGGGLAGLYGLLQMPDDWNVIVVDKGGPAGSSPLAQGGMAVAVAPEDSPAIHAADTIVAGAGACVSAAVDVLTQEAPGRLRDLIRLGCEFDVAPDGSLDLALEGAQSVHRSVHAADATGRELMRVVVRHARERARRVVGTALRLVVDQGRCAGAIVLTEDGLVPILARGVLMASGGCGALYESTTNSPASTGDGVALAYLAGAEVADLEFVQFHPTALAVGEQQRVLLTEALRGEGAHVIDEDGRRFVFDHHPNGELGPRDVVARAIASRGGAWLDARPIGADVVRKRFPNVREAVGDHGFDLASEPVPVAPAAHYFLGGVATDLEGRTTVPGLYAAGECAATGVHGANRMAGNSLAEAVVFGARAALSLVREDRGQAQVDADMSGIDTATASGTEWGALRKHMTEGAGLSRTSESLDKARRGTEELADATRDERFRLAATAGSLICRAAGVRAESRGTHYRADHPAPSTDWEGVHVTLSRT